VVSHHLDGFLLHGLRRLVASCCRPWDSPCFRRSRATPRSAFGRASPTVPHPPEPSPPEQPCPASPRVLAPSPLPDFHPTRPRGLAPLVSPLRHLPVAGETTPVALLGFPLLEP
jgi:hypothetical protein